MRLSILYLKIFGVIRLVIGRRIEVRDIPGLRFGPCAVAVPSHVGDVLRPLPHVGVPEAVHRILSYILMYGIAILVKVHLISPLIYLIDFFVVSIVFDQGLYLLLVLIG